MYDFGISEPGSTKQHTIVRFDSLAVNDSKCPIYGIPWMWISTSFNRPVGLAMVLLAIFRLKGAGDGFGSPSLRRSSSVMTLTPDPPSKRISSITFLPMHIEITGMCLSMASVAAISSSIVGVLLGGATTVVSHERTKSVSDGERLKRSRIVT